MIAGTVDCVYAYACVCKLIHLSAVVIANLLYRTYFTSDCLKQPSCRCTITKLSINLLPECNQAHEDCHVTYTSQPCGWDRSSPNRTKTPSSVCSWLEVTRWCEMLMIRSYEVMRENWIYYPSRRPCFLVRIQLLLRDGMLFEDCHASLRYPCL